MASTSSTGPAAAAAAAAAAAPLQTIKIGVIGGTGLTELIGQEEGKRIEVETPLGKPSGPIILTKWNGVEVALMQRHGEGHLLNPSTVPYRANIFAMKSLGVTHLVAISAVGSLQEKLAPKDLVITSNAIDKTFKRDGSFFEKAAVHTELADPFCPVMRRWLLDSAAKLKATETSFGVHDGGVYVCMEGPGFSSRAESQMHRLWGGDVIGMTLMPECKLAREAEIAYAQIALVTDYDSWRPHDAAVGNPAQLLEEILGNLKVASENALKLIKAALADTLALAQTRSPAQDSLRLAIVSAKNKIDPAEVAKLKPIWGRYFE